MITVLVARHDRRFDLFYVGVNVSLAKKSSNRRVLETGLTAGI